MSAPATDKLAAKRKEMKRYALDAFLEATAIFVVMKILAWVTISRLPAGRQFVLEPAGLGLVYEAVTRIVGMTFFFILYTLPAFSVRKWLGCLLQALMFLLLIVFLTYIDCRHYVAVVETRDAFVCVRSIPFRSDRFPKNQLPLPMLRKTNAVRYLRFATPDQITKPVFHADREANLALDNLLEALQQTLRQPIVPKAD